MKQLNTYILEKLHLDKNIKVNSYNYHPEDKVELIELIKNRLEETEEYDKLDLNDIDTSKIVDMAYIFQMVKGDNWYMDRNFHCGGVYGAMIGTQDMEKSIDFYKNILGYDVIVSDETGNFEDFAYLNAPGQFRRVVLTHSQPRTGSFSKIFSDSQIELVQSLDRTDIHKIFEGRMS